WREGGEEADGRTRRRKGGCALHARAARHRNIKENQIGLQRGDVLHRLLAVSRLTAHLHATELGEQTPQPLPRRLFIVHQQRADHHRTLATTSVRSSSAGWPPPNRSTSARPELTT